MATENLKRFPQSQQATCPHCAKPVTLYDPDGSEYVICTECWSYLRWYADKKILETQQTLPAIQYEHILDPGTIGIINGTEYKVLAYMEKKEAGTDYEWLEYMLWSYEKGYAFLAVYNGHWSFIAGIEHFPELKDVILDGSSAYLGDNEYKEYNRYTPVITALKGEFDWDVYEERIGSREFICPPYMLVRERNKKNESIIDWYWGEYITPREIADGFKVGIEKFPEQVDIGANQPNITRIRYKQILRISILAAILMVILQLLCVIIKPQQTLMTHAVSLISPAVKKDTTKKDSSIYASALPNATYEFLPQRTASFTIENGPAPVDLYLAAPVENNWMESTVELVSEKDNQTWDVTKEIEYYSGYDDEGTWSEGSTNGTITVDNIPSGRYHLNVYPYAGTQSLNSLDLRVTANVILWQNVLITLLVLMLAPLAFWYFQRRFEVNRWMNSDFSPYNKGTNNDD
ncbi:MAG: DUF4178 domain-containing protein [Mucilaginibacter sp.]